MAAITARRGRESGALNTPRARNNITTKIRHVYRRAEKGRQIRETGEHEVSLTKEYTVHLVRLLA